MALTFVDQDEHLKYSLWSDYVKEILARWESQDKPVPDNVDHWTYFEWLDFYGLS